MMRRSRSDNKIYELFKKKYKFKLIFRRFWKISGSFVFRIIQEILGCHIDQKLYFLAWQNFFLDSGTFSVVIVIF